jgi:hypothetical protein
VLITCPVLKFPNTWKPQALLGFYYNCHEPGVSWGTCYILLQSPGVPLFCKWFNYKTNLIHVLMLKGFLKIVFYYRTYLVLVMTTRKILVFLTITRYSFVQI